MATSKKKTTQKKKSTRKKRKGLSQGIRVFLASAFLLGFVAICLFLLVSLRERLLPERADSLAKDTFVYEEPVNAVPIQPLPATYEDIHQLLELQLINGPESMGWKRLPQRKDVEVRKVFGDFPSQLFLAELAQHIEQTGAPAQLKVSREKGLVHLFWDDQLRLELLYEVPKAVEKPPIFHDRGKIAIIMDDMGESLSTIKSLVDIGIIVTPAILPGTSHATSSAELLQKRQREFMIHIPMEPRNYPQVNPGSDALLVNFSADEIRQRVENYLQAVPGAVGGNNHMGSRFTEESGPMQVVLEELKARDFFFIDSRTISNSVAFSEARKLGMKTATRNIFLDNEANVPYIREQLRKMVKLAGNNKEIVAICHPHKETLEAIRQELAWFKTQPVDFVNASELVHVY